MINTLILILIGNLYHNYRILFTKFLSIFSKIMYTFYLCLLKNLLKIKSIRK
jgi:hypothetical protein